MPKVKTKKKSTSKKTASKGNSNRGPVGRPVGKTSGVGVTQTWIQAFTQNEKASKAKRLDDPAISTFMKREFKGRESNVFDQVQGVRNKYNKGGLTGGDVPSVQSKRYDGDGNPSPSSRGRPAADADGKGKKGKKVSRRGKAA